MANENDQPVRKPAVRKPKAESKAKDISPPPAKVIAGDIDDLDTGADKSLRAGGATPLPTETLVNLGGHLLVVDKAHLITCALGLKLAENPAEWLSANRASVRSAVFVPARPGLARHYPLVSPSGVPDGPIQFRDFPVKQHFPGMHVIAGPMGGGKTEWVQASGVEVIVRFGEPLDMVDLQSNVVQVTDLLEALSFTCVLAMADYSVALDSLREMIFGLTGAAGSGGISVSLYSVITSFDKIYSSLNLLVLAVVNPMMDADKAELVYRNIGSSVSGMSVIVDGRVQSQTARTRLGRKFTSNIDRYDASPDDARSAVTVHDPIRGAKLLAADTLESRLRLDRNDTTSDDPKDDSTPRQAARTSSLLR
jgi:hypothetical protein